MSTSSLLSLSKIESTLVSGMFEFFTYIIVSWLLETPWAGRRRTVFSLTLLGSILCLLGSTLTYLFCSRHSVHCRFSQLSTILIMMSRFSFAGTFTALYPFTVRQIYASFPFLSAVSAISLMSLPFHVLSSKYVPRLSTSHTIIHV